jgi:hypothetical protein
VVELFESHPSSSTSSCPPDKLKRKDLKEKKRKPLFAEIKAKLNEV